MSGESSARGIELVTRSEARGRGLVCCGDGVGGMGGVDWRAEGGGGEWTCLVAGSSHAAWAEGSTGHADGGCSFGGGG